MHRKGIGPRSIGSHKGSDCGCPHSMMIIAVAPKVDMSKTKKKPKMAKK